MTRAFRVNVPSTVFPELKACRVPSATVCCRHGAGELRAVQRDGVEAGAARGWRGGQRGGGVRLRDGGSRDAGDGAGADSEAVRALRFRELRHGSDGWKNVDGAARAIVEAGEAA